MSVVVAVYRITVQVHMHTKVSGPLLLANACHAYWFYILECLACFSC